MTDNTQPEAMDLADCLEAVGGGPSAKRSADSATTTYTVRELAHAKGVPRIVTDAMLAMGENLSEALDKLHVLESVTKRMALDLECVLVNPFGWDKQAFESLQAYRDLMDAWYPQDYVSPLGKD